MTLLPPGFYEAIANRPTFDQLVLKTVAYWALGLGAICFLILIVGAIFVLEETSAPWHARLGGLVMLGIVVLVGYQYLLAIGAVP